MENSKGKSVKEKNGFISLFNFPHFFLVCLIRVLHLIICVLLFFNNPLFLVKVRLLWVCLVLENLKERRKEIERKINERKQIRLFLNNLKERGFLNFNFSYFNLFLRE